MIGLDKQVKGLDRINARILEQANEYAAGQLENAAKQAEASSAKVLDAAKEKAAEIVQKAKESAASLRENAKSSAGMRERSHLLSLKAEMCDSAFDAAVEKLAHLPGDMYVPAMARLLASAVNSQLADGERALLVMNPKDASFADEILAQAKKDYTKKVTVEKADYTTGIRAGFILECSDIEINCSAEKLIASARDSLEKTVLGILFNE